ncbi:hypothetical protein THF1C08_190057 [Vibrio jasicida]|uniref:Uncharacterized protein n=1 Tax=Vibrio jasicida TaxID=766224 RepID=A0AAU9QNE2_9VIBR|nr:hypothetical protein THF1C08_190057 [Vibrio jasicida]CAH1588419.1 hypothetical protein THF1A12_200057 [Vibrio jasicida]
MNLFEHYFRHYFVIKASLRVEIVHLKTNEKDGIKNENNSTPRLIQFGSRKHFIGNTTRH